VAAATLESIMDFRLTEPEIRGIDFNFGLRQQYKEGVKEN